MDRFFKAKWFLVVGASKHVNKFGYKVLKWYTDKGLNVTPIHPTEHSILGIECYKSVREFINGKDAELVAVSIITPPAVTQGILKDLMELGVLRVWCQPGSFNEQCIALLHPDYGIYDKCILKDSKL